MQTHDLTRTTTTPNKKLLQNNQTATTTIDNTNKYKVVKYKKIGIFNQFFYIWIFTILKVTIN